MELGQDKKQDLERLGWLAWNCSLESCAWILSFFYNFLFYLEGPEVFAVLLQFKQRTTVA